MYFSSNAWNDAIELINEVHVDPALRAGHHDVQSGVKRIINNVHFQHGTSERGADSLLALFDGVEGYSGLKNIIDLNDEAMGLSLR